MFSGYAFSSRASRYSFLAFVIILSFGYGMASQAWGLFPKRIVEKAYWELYAKPDVHAKTTSYEADSSRIQKKNWKLLRTSLYEVTVDRIDLPLRSQVEKTHGGIDDLYSGALVVSNLGDLYYLDRNRGLHELPVTVPFSRDNFDEVARPQDLTRRWFGVKDLLVREESPSRFRVFVSSHHWYAEEECYTLQFETALLSREGTGRFSLQEEWNRVYETRPCLPIKMEGDNDFAGLEAGGAMQVRSDSELLLTVGGHGRDGLNGDKKVITDSTTSYGKIIAVDLQTGKSSVVSMGHRNPQGLYVDSQGRVWSTEHGPEGGDELNLIKAGKNYGWPHVTYGTDYGAYQWPLSDTVGAHPGYARPRFAWVPSIAVCELTGVEGNLFEKWEGDLLISSLKKKTLYRARMHNGRVMYVEPMELGSRLRDVVELKDGTILLKTHRGSLLALQPREQPPA